MTRALSTALLCLLLGSLACGRFGFDPQSEDACPQGQACDDGDPCTIDDRCTDGRCAGRPWDNDGDGHAPIACGGDDCNDDNPAVHGGMEEALSAGNCDDGLDNDCNGLQDDQESECRTEDCSPDGWCLKASPAGETSLNAVYGTSCQDVWVAGDQGLLLHYDGVNFQELDLGTVANLRAIRAVAHDQIWIAGDGGTVLRINSTDPLSFENLQTPLDTDWFDLRGMDEQRVLLIGRGAQMLEWTSTAWVAHDPSPMNFDFRGLWLDPEGSQWVVGDSADLWWKPDTVWQSAFVAGDFVRWNKICGLDSEHIYWVGSHGHRGFRDGGTWAANGWNESSDMPELFGVACLDQPFRALAVGQEGSIWQDQVGSLQQQTSGVGSDLHAVWTDGQGCFVAVGAAGTVLFKQE